MGIRQSEIAKETFQVYIDKSDLPATKGDIGLRLGYPPGDPPEPFGAMIEEELSQAPAHLLIQAGYRLLPAHRPAERSAGLEIGGVYFSTKNIVAAELRKAESVAVFVCTIGPGLETRAAALTAAGEPAQGFIVDSLASELAERTADVLHQHIARTLAARGLGTSNRYSPGYCNWDVAEQRLLFSLLPAGFCGIRLTDSALMLPIKSVSGIIGAGPAVEFRGYRCDTCGVKDCVYRSIRLRNRK